MRKVKLYITDGYGHIPTGATQAFLDAGVRMGSHRQGATLVTGYTKTDAVAAAQAAKAGTVYEERQLRVLGDGPTFEALSGEGYLDTPGWVFASPIDSSGIARVADIDEDGTVVWRYLGKVDNVERRLDTMERANSLDQAIDLIAELAHDREVRHDSRLSEALELTVNAARAEATRYRIQLQNAR